MLVLGLQTYSWFPWSFCSFIPSPSLAIKGRGPGEGVRIDCRDGPCQEGPSGCSPAYSLLCDLGHTIHLLWALVSLWKSNSQRA